MLAFIADASALRATDTNPPPRLTVELRDGSRVVGESVDRNWRFHSALLGDFKLEVPAVRSLEFVSTNSTRLTTANGDVLNIQFENRALRVASGFGKVEIPVENLRRLSVSAARGGLAADFGLVARYPLGGDARDASGNGNDGTAQNVSPATDRLGHAGAASLFAGSPDSKIAVNSTNLMLQPPFSCSLWAKFTSGGGQNPRLISMGGYEIGTGGTGVSRSINFNNATQQGVIDCPSPDSFPQDEWHFVVAVRSLDAMSLWVDGRLENTVPAAGALVYRGFGSSWLPTIGGSGGLGYPYDTFAGSISDVRFYNRALEPEEIRQMSHAD